MALTTRTAPASTSLWRLSWRGFQFWLAYYAKVWRGSIVSVFLTPVLYLASLGLGLGTLVNRNGSAHLNGTSYLVFLAPGLLAGTAMQTAFIAATYDVLGSAKWTRTYHAAVATPLDATAVMLGHLMYMVFRIAFASAVYVAVLAAFGAAKSPMVLLALPAAVLTGTAFAAPVSAWAVTREQDSSFAALGRFGIVPLFLFSGTFFPVGRLPVGLRVVAYATPLWHGVDLCRSLALATATWGMTVVHIAYLAAMTLLGIGAARVAYRRRLTS